MASRNLKIQTPRRRDSSLSSSSDEESENWQADPVPDQASRWSRHVRAALPPMKSATNIAKTGECAPRQTNEGAKAPNVKVKVLPNVDELFSRKRPGRSGESFQRIDQDTFPSVAPASVALY